MVFFPAIKFKNLRGSNKVWWNFRDFVQLHPADQPPSQLSTVAALTLSVCTEMERRSLAYSRTMEKYRDHRMPWMQATLSRLPPAIKGMLSVKVVTFVSSIGMIMNGDFIQYNHLLTLLKETSPVASQADLQKLNILSKFTLPKVYKQCSLSYKPTSPFASFRHPVLGKFPKKADPPVDDQLIDADVQAVNDQDGIQPMVWSSAMCLPANTHKAWSEWELSFVTKDEKVKLQKHVYQEVSGGKDSHKNYGSLQTKEKQSSEVEGYG